MNKNYLKFLQHAFGVAPKQNETSSGLGKGLLKYSIIALFTLLLFTRNEASAQLVANGDFELYPTCPTTFVGSGSVYAGQPTGATGWICPTQGTADYSNTCGWNAVCRTDVNSALVTRPLTGIPSCGGRTSPTSNGYVGFYVANRYAMDVEYVQQALTTTLVAGNTYSITFIAARGGTTETSPVTTFGAVFSSTQLSNTSSDLITNWASYAADPIKSTVSVDANSVAALSNTAWSAPITLTFTAVGGEKYITIGSTYTPPTGASRQYVIIDGLSVQLVCTAGTAQVPLSGNTLSNTCPTPSVNLNSLVTGTAPGTSTLEWYTNAAHTGSPVSATTTTAGTYYAFYHDTVNGCFNTATSTAQVNVTINACAAGTVDCSKTQIFPAPVQGTASQLDLVVTVNVTMAGPFTPTVSGSGMSLAMPGFTVTPTATGIQTFHIPIKYDGSTLGTMTFGVAPATPTCTADLTKTPKGVITNIWTLDCLPTVGPTFK